MRRKRDFPEKPIIGSVEWQRKVIREEARDTTKNEDNKKNEFIRKAR